mgnify:CR=1 FL=1
MGQIHDIEKLKIQDRQKHSGELTYEYIKYSS